VRGPLASFTTCQIQSKSAIFQHLHFANFHHLPAFFNSDRTKIGQFFERLFEPVSNDPARVRPSCFRPAFVSLSDVSRNGAQSAVRACFSCAGTGFFAVLSRSIVAFLIFRLTCGSAALRCQGDFLLRLFVPDVLQSIKTNSYIEKRKL
jgi:hypothetical protein